MIFLNQVQANTRTYCVKPLPEHKKTYKYCVKPLPEQEKTHAYCLEPVPKHKKMSIFSTSRGSNSIKLTIRAKIQKLFPTFAPH
jgi:hypothetical protein